MTGIQLNTTGSPITVVAFAVVLVVAGAFLAFWGYGTYQDQQAVLDEAVEVDATVVDTDIQRQRATGPSDDETPTDEFEYRLTVTFALATHHPTLATTETTLSAERVESGEPVEAEVAVENVGPAADPADVTLLADGEPVGEARIAPEPGDDATVMTSVTFDDPDEYELTVAGDAVVDAEPVATITVVEPAEETPAVDPPGTEPESSVENGAPTPEPGGFGLEEAAGVVALLAIVLTTLLLVRRMPR